jgi:hypothetical protein
MNCSERGVLATRNSRLVGRRRGPSAWKRQILPPTCLILDHLEKINNIKGEKYTAD